ncbi:homologous-pairing protein 2 homolog isoform X2 [Cavia porcellus]|uniref:homologous-pairing protein 2 homolog isoform X2 n=1 Tax=Cavia porcellus TaxID=10141 RepID=UPI002FE02FD7
MPRAPRRKALLEIAFVPGLGGSVRNASGAEMNHCAQEGQPRSREASLSANRHRAGFPSNQSPEGFLSSQSSPEARPSLPEGAFILGNHDIRFSVWRRETAMSKGRAEAAAGAPGVVLRYLQEQNRPYSAQDVFGNLQREHGLGKAAVVKALEQLAQQGKIREKTYGKQKIYFAGQDQFDTVSDADLQTLDAKIVALTAKVQSLQQSCRHLEAELKELTSALTTPEMQREIEQLKAQCAVFTERLQGIKGAAAHVTPEEKEQVRAVARGRDQGEQSPAKPHCPHRCTSSGSGSAGSGVCARGWRPSYVKPSLKATRRARRHCLRRWALRRMRTTMWRPQTPETSVGDVPASFSRLSIPGLGAEQHGALSPAGRGPWVPGPAMSQWFEPVMLAPALEQMRLEEHT